MRGTISGKCSADERVHTKVGECSMFEGTPKGLIFHNKNASYPLDPGTFETAIQAAIYANDITRITPVMDYSTALTVTGGDLRTNQEGYGPEAPNGINPYREDYVLNTGGDCLFKQLMKLNGKQMRVFKVDESNACYGTVATVGGGGVLRGYLVSIGVTKRTNTGDTSPAIILSLLYSANYQNELTDMNAFELTNDVEGLSGVYLKKTGSGTATVNMICSGEDITSVYGDDLGAATLYEDEDGANPTSVAYANGVLTFTPAGSYKIVDAATLHSADIVGIEGENIYTDLT